MSKRLIKEDALNIINKICKENNYSFLGFCDDDGNDCDWYGCNSKLKLHCNICNNVWKTTSFYLFRKGIKCRKCNAKKTRNRIIEKFENVIKNDIDLICKNRNYKFIELCNRNGEKSEWIGVKDTYLKIECLECGKIWNINYDNLRRGKGCPICAKFKIAKTYFSEIKKDLTEKSLIEDYEIIEIYKDGKVIGDIDKDFKISKKRINIKTKCNKCGNIWETNYYNFMRHKCKVCQNNLNSIKKIEQTKLKYYDKIIKLCKERNYEFLGFSNKNNEDCEWYGASTYLKLKCNKCGNIWNTCTCYNFVHHLRGCPKCNQSHLELHIEQLLKRENIDFTVQKRFNWLGYLSLDFYLLKYNIGIECQGKQHFEQGGWIIDKDQLKKNYEEIIERDTRKLKLCEENNVKLLYYSNLNIKYPYDVIEDENVLLQKILENN